VIKSGQHCVTWSLLTFPLFVPVASLDVAFQEITFRGRNSMDVPELAARWEVPMNLDAPARQHIRGHEIGYYLRELEAVRADTLAQLKQRDDDWLWHESPDGDTFINNYYYWYHVYEDEINHRGEINWRLSRIPPA